MCFASIHKIMMNKGRLVVSGLKKKKKLYKGTIEKAFPWTYLTRDWTFYFVVHCAEWPSHS